MPKGSDIQPQTSDKQIEGRLLNPEERSVCEQIATGKAPWSQRAQALLAVNDGDSEAVAAESAGLRDTQVKYWLSAFRRKRADIFPEHLLKGSTVDSAVPDSKIPEDDSPSAETSEKTRKSKKAKKTKGKQGKRSNKKEKKPKKGKRKKKKNKRQAKQKSK